MTPAPLRRLRPLLGTYVQIEADDAGDGTAAAAIEAAFARIAAIEAAMSFHHQGSELSRLNRDAHRIPQPVGPDTRRVLEYALELARLSDGAFDPCIAPQLVAGRLLPPPDGAAPPAGGSWRDLHILDDSRIGFARPLWLDLGGIAKGYAVDQAIDALLARGMRWAAVNAGGDLRHACRAPFPATGCPPLPVMLRNPVDPSVLIPFGHLCNGALATSGEAVLGRPGPDVPVSPLVDPLTGLRPARARSVSVWAPTCWLADGLTKIVALQGMDSHPLLEALGCEAAIIETDARVHASPGFWTALKLSHLQSEHHDA